MRIAPAAASDTEALVALWNDCGLLRPWNDPRADVERALAGDHSTVLAGHDGGALVASAMVGEDGHRGWVYYVATRPDRRGEGLGAAIMEAAEAWLAARGVLKLNLMIRNENEAVRRFYEGQGYGGDGVIVLSKRLDG